MADMLVKLKSAKDDGDKATYTADHATTIGID